MKEGLEIKIKELFDYRGLPELLDIAGAKETEKQSLIDKLTELQKDIYYLDHVLETEHEINSEVLKLKWEAIYESLRKFNIPEERLESYCKQIFRYQTHELSQRKGKSVVRFNLEYFYFYKSCDVKLLRRIIYNYYPILNKKFTLSDWRSFDLFTEINDDVLDVYEDIGTINGNRFLIGIEEESLDKCVADFQLFMNEINSKYEKIRLKYHERSLINTLTDNAFLDTTKLLKVRKEDLKSCSYLNKKIVENSLLNK